MLYLLALHYSNKRIALIASFFFAVLPYIPGRYQPCAFWGWYPAFQGKNHWHNHVGSCAPIPAFFPSQHRYGAAIPKRLPRRLSEKQGMRRGINPNRLCEWIRLQVCFCPTLKTNSGDLPVRSEGIQIHHLEDVWLFCIDRIWQKVRPNGQYVPVR